MDKMIWLTTLFALVWLVTSETNFKRTFKGALAVPTYRGQKTICSSRQRCYESKCALASDITVEPIVTVAIEDVKRRYGITVNRNRNTPWLTVKSYDILCNNQTQNTHTLLGEPSQADVVFIPFCDYSIVTAAHVMAYYKVPVMSVGASAADLRGPGAAEEYPMLVRTTVSNAQTELVLNAVVESQLWNWEKVLYLYQMKFACNEILHEEGCRIFAKNLVESRNLVSKPFVTATAKDVLLGEVGAKFGVAVKYPMINDRMIRQCKRYRKLPYLCSVHSRYNSIFRGYRNYNLALLPAKIEALEVQRQIRQCAKSTVEMPHS